MQALRARAPAACLCGSKVKKSQINTHVVRKISPGVQPCSRPSLSLRICLRALVPHHQQSVYRGGMNPPHYAESIEPTTMLLRDAAPWLEKPYKPFLCRAVASTACRARVRKPYRRRAPSPSHIGRSRECHLHGRHREDGMRTCERDGAGQGDRGTARTAPGATAAGGSLGTHALATARQRAPCRHLRSCARVW